MTTALGQKAISTLTYMMLMYPRIEDYPEELVDEIQMFLEALDIAEKKGECTDNVAVFYAEIECELKEGFYLEKEEYEQNMEEALNGIFICPEKTKEKIMTIIRNVKKTDW
jgi:hypothetical protein